MLQNEEKEANKLQSDYEISNEEMERFCLFQQPDQNYWESKAYELTGYYIQKNLKENMLQDAKIPSLQTINQRIIELTLLPREFGVGIEFKTLNSKEIAELNLLKQFERIISNILTSAQVSGFQKTIINGIAGCMLSYLRENQDEKEHTRKIIVDNLKLLKRDAKLGHFFQSSHQKVLKALYDFVDKELSQHAQPFPK